MELINQLRVFVGVAKNGGFTAAAAQLDLPRSTVSLAVRQLEARLGTRLLHRTTRRVSLTADGQSLLERARLLVEDADELQQLFRTQGTDLRGRLRVDVPSRIARRLVAPALPTFFERYPNVLLELGSSDRAIDLVGEGIDCALRVGELPSSSLVARHLGRLPLVNCASPAYLARHGIPDSPRSLLQQHQAVLYGSSSSGRTTAWEWQEDGRVHTIALSGRVVVNNAETYIACGVAGLGLIQVPAFDVQEHLARGELVEVLHDWPVPAMPVQLVYPHHRHLSRRLQAFNTWLAAILAPVCNRENQQALP